MTASIVGWAHTPFGKLEQETVESLIVRIATDALADALRRGMSTKSFSGISTPASPRRTSPRRSSCRRIPPCVSSPQRGLKTPAQPDQWRYIRPSRLSARVLRASFWSSASSR